jgi:hypothetical protein
MLDPCKNDAVLGTGTLRLAFGLADDVKCGLSANAKFAPDTPAIEEAETILLTEAG